jgi:hypothetical protein
VKHGKSDLESKRPRYHPVIAWEANNLQNDFIDINRMALDDRYGHNGAPLSKRRNGSGPTDGSTPGLFGMVDYQSQRGAYFGGMVAATSAYLIADWYLSKGYAMKGWKRRIARSPLTAAILVLGFYLVAPTD